MIIQRVRYGNHTRVESLIPRFIPADQQNGLPEWVKHEKDSEGPAFALHPQFFHVLMPASLYRINIGTAKVPLLTLHLSNRIFPTGL